MAVLRTYVPLDMTDTRTRIGETTYADDRYVMIETGRYTTVYIGDFEYPDGRLAGTIRGMEAYYDDVMTFAVRNISLDARYGNVGSSRSEAYQLALKGNDRLFGSTGDDKLLAFAGADILKGAAGDDILAGEAGLIASSAAREMTSCAAAMTLICCVAAAGEMSTSAARAPIGSSLGPMRAAIGSGTSRTASTGWKSLAARPFPTWRLPRPEAP